MQNKKDERGEMGSGQNVKRCFLFFCLLLQTPIKCSSVQEPNISVLKTLLLRARPSGRAVSLHRRAADSEPWELCVSVSRALARDSLSESLEVEAVSGGNEAAASEWRGTAGDLFLIAADFIREPDIHHLRGDKPHVSDV